MRVVQALGPSAKLADRKTAVQRSINLRLCEVEGVGEDKPAVMKSSPGLVSVYASGVVRGAYVAESRAFFVVGNTLYERTSEAAVVSRGVLSSVSGFVSMKHGINQLVIVDGPSGYVFNLDSGAFAEIADPAWRGSDWVDYLDGYFVFVDPDTEQFYISAIDDASILDALDFSSADTQPDNIVTHRGFKREIYFFGERSTEVWVNAGDADFPLVRYNATPIQVGIVGKRALCIAADTLFFVGKTDRGNGHVYALNGYQPVRISQTALEEALSASTDLSACVMWSYHSEGAELIGVEAPGMETTWVYDAAAKQWHEQARLVDGQWLPMGMDHLTFWSGKHYAYFQNAIHRIDKTAYAYGTESLVRERTWPHLVSPSLEPVTFRSLEIACSTGTLDAAGAQGAVTLEVSNDGGYTWGAPLMRYLGATGRWMERIRWMFLGASRDRVFRLRTNSAVPFTLHAATVQT